MIKYLLPFLAALSIVFGVPAQVQAGGAFSGLNLDRSAIRFLEKAESLYMHGNFDRAYFIYRHELAPSGDKYAQYMVGFMNLTGQGTDADRVAAAAWYRLAAERGTREFLLVHNQLLVSLTSEQVSEYEHLFIDLRKRYGDLVLLMRAVRRDYDLLTQRTGSRLGSETGAVTVIEMRDPKRFRTSEHFFQGVENRLETRLAVLARYIDINIDDLDIDRLDLKNIEELVNQELNSLE